MFEHAKLCVVTPLHPRLPAPSEPLPWSLDVLANANGMVLADICLPQRVLDSVLLLLQHSAYVIADNGTLIVINPEADTAPAVTPPLE